MKKVLPLIALLSAVLLALVSCKGHYIDPGAMGGSGGFGSGGFSGGGGSKSKLDPDIVGKWYASGSQVGGNDWAFEITADGGFSLPPDPNYPGNDPVLTCTASGGKLKVFVPEYNNQEAGSADYVISGNQLTLTGGTALLMAFCLVYLNPFSK